MIKLFYPAFWQYKGLLSIMLWPLSQIYLLLGKLRQLIAKPIRFKAQVICTGNVTVGGTGKTQIVIWLSKLLHEKNVRFVIVTKAYKGKINNAELVGDAHSVEDVGDESILLSKYGQVIAAKNVRQIVNLISRLNPQVIIFDDGMQNPNFYKDCNILVVDGARGLGNEFLIPAGPLRQSFSQGLNLSEMLIIFDKDKASRLKLELENYKKPIFEARTIPVAQNNFNFSVNYFAFCSIGNPEKFFSTLKDASFKLVKTKTFPDHYYYNARDIEDLLAEALKLDALLITTTKDYVKIPKEFINANIMTLETEIIIDNENILKNFINEKIIHKI